MTPQDLAERFKAGPDTPDRQRKLDAACSRFQVSRAEVDEAMVRMLAAVKLERKWER